MSNNNQKKADQLGMPAGTAANRLRKQLLFKYVQLAGDDHCYACSEKIESVDDFTIEHKQKWLDVDPDLFWNLDNIAFSHKECNIPHSYREKISKHGDIVTYRKHGCRCDECKEIHSEYMRRYRSSKK